MPTLLVTGANRGLGLEFVRQYSAAGWSVLATCRDPDGAEALKQLAREPKREIAIHKLDVTDPEDVKALAAELGQRGIASLCIGGGEATAMAVELV